MIIKLKTYPVSGITSGEVNLKALDDEIRASGFVDSLGSLGKEGDDIIVYGVAISNSAGLDQLVMNHGGEDIEKLRQNLLAEVDTAAQDKRKKFSIDSMDYSRMNKKLEAQKFKDSGYPEEEIDNSTPFTGFYPYVSAHKDAMDLNTGQESADDILTVTSAEDKKDAEIEDHREKGRRRIKETNNRALMRTRKADAINNINTVI